MIQNMQNKGSAPVSQFEPDGKRFQNRNPNRTIGNVDKVNKISFAKTSYKDFNKMTYERDPSVN